MSTKASTNETTTKAKPGRGLPDKIRADREAQSKTTTTLDPQRFRRVEKDAEGNPVERRRPKILGRT